MLIPHLKHTVNYCKAKLNFKVDQKTFNTALAFSLAAIVLTMPGISSAGDAVAGVICNIVDELQGPVARGVAAFGIIFLGFSLFLGKISWGVALALGIGIGAIFGADAIVGVMDPKGTASCVDGNAGGLPDPDPDAGI